VQGIVDHLFRHEAGRMIAYLTRVFGMRGLALAEDVVQDTLYRALEVWPVRGLPDNPAAWLMGAARNRALDLVRRDAHFRGFAPDLIRLLEQRDEEPGEVAAGTAGAAFDREIRDDQLRMIFACCAPELSVEAQVTLILKTLCGFSVGEIAQALLAGEDAVEKRLHRAREFFRNAPGRPEIPDTAAMPGRLDAVHQAIYLLFNEGYHGSHRDQTMREDLCYEALRLALLLTEYPEGRTPKTHALLALLCFQAARLPGRMDGDDSLIQLEMQDRGKWDRGLMERGFGFLDSAATGETLSEYHLQAAIASVHCAAATYGETDWAGIVDLYDLLYAMRPAPIVALNRAIALGMARGPEAGLAELGRIPDAGRLKEYPFLPAAFGEFHLRAGREEEAGRYFGRAMELARSRAEKGFFERKIRECRGDFGGS
jgi:RNA polymerase sigma factor (sigma-70 family)